MPQRKKGPQPGDRKWFRVEAKKDNAAEVLIYDEIGRGFFGGGVVPEDLVKEIKSLGLTASDELKVRINSPGGDFADGLTIYNYLRTLKPTVSVRIDGVAASAASMIAMAGDTVQMPENAMMFIHNPWMFAAGDARVMRKVAEDLDKLAESAVLTYMRKAGDKMDRDELVSMLNEETWLSAEESVKFGLADAIDEPVRAAALAQFDFAKYGFAVPKELISAKQSLAESRQAQRERLKLLKF